MSMLSLVNQSNIIAMSIVPSQQADNVIPVFRCYRSAATEFNLSDEQRKRLGVRERD
jgi:hypothetical protein